MVAIAEQIVLGARLPVLGIERETGDMIVDEAARDSAFARDDAERVECRVARHLSVERGVGQEADCAQPRHRIDDDLPLAAMVLSVGQIVTAAAPAVQQPSALAGGLIEEFGGNCEGLGTLGNRFCSGRDDRGAVCYHSCAAVILKIVSCG